MMLEDSGTLINIHDCEFGFGHVLLILNKHNTIYTRQMISRNNSSMKKQMLLILKCDIKI